MAYISGSNGKIAVAGMSILTLESLHQAPHTPMRTTELLGMIGTQDMILFFLVVLLLFGAKKLPELARGLGKTMGEFKKAREEFDHEITQVVAQGETEARAKDPVAK